MKKPAIWLVSAMVLGSGILTGCNSTKPATQPQTTNETNTTVASNPSNTVSSTTNTAPGENTSSGATTSQVTNASPASSNIDQIVKQYLAFAKAGKIRNIPFAEQSNMDAVYHAWGQEQETSAGAGLYTTYANHSTAFGFNKGGQIFDLRSYNSEVKAMTQQAIVRALGQPGAIRYTADSYIYMYPAGTDYQLLFVFQKDKSGKPMSHVDHVSVFWPQGTINIMAQTDPAPSIVINNPPGEAGSLFTFSIQHTPKNYHLAELEWIPNRGSSVVDTLSQALASARSGHNPPGFTISQDGQTMSFTYTGGMIGQSGHARVIFQNDTGVAMIGDSPEITLK